MLGAIKTQENLLKVSKLFELACSGDLNLEDIEEHELEEFQEEEEDNE